AQAPAPRDLARDPRSRSRRAGAAARRHPGRERSHQRPRRSGRLQRPGRGRLPADGRPRRRGDHAADRAPGRAVRRRPRDGRRRARRRHVLAVRLLDRRSLEWRGLPVARGRPRVGQGAGDSRGHAAGRLGLRPLDVARPGRLRPARPSPRRRGPGSAEVAGPRRTAPAATRGGAQALSLPERMQGGEVQRRPAGHGPRRAPRDLPVVRPGAGGPRPRRVGGPRRPAVDGPQFARGRGLRGGGLHGQRGLRDPARPHRGRLPGLVRRDRDGVLQEPDLRCPIRRADAPGSGGRRARDRPRARARRRLPLRAPRPHPARRGAPDVRRSRRALRARARRGPEALRLPSAAELTRLL
ncbi:MAG: hypothetical protein AVDCRST_MAG30-1051, partial [uncultured Solirubrobacteraceae bacterium]